MPPKRYNIYVLVEAFNSIIDTPIERLRSSLLIVSVKQSTLKTYYTEVKKLLTWSNVRRAVAAKLVDTPNYKLTVEDAQPLQKEQGIMEDDFVTLGSTFTQDDFITFMSAHGAHHPLQFDRIRAVIRLGQMMAGVPIWACDEISKTMEHAAYNMAIVAEPRIPRGTLTSKMVLDLVAWVRVRNPRAADAMIIQFSACLRIDELTNLRPHHVSDKGIILIETKRDRAGAVTSIVPRATLKEIHHWPDGAKALQWLIEHAKVNRDCHLLFPRTSFTKKAYNALIKEGALALGFPKELRYDGSHVLRHAGVGCAVRHLIQSRPLTDIHTLLHMSLQTLNHYSQSIEDRIRKITVPLFIANKIINPHLIQPREDSESDDEPEPTIAPPAPKRNGAKRNRTDEVPTSQEREAMRIEQEAARQQTLERRQQSSHIRLEAVLRETERKRQQRTDVYWAARGPTPPV